MKNLLLPLALFLATHFPITLHAQAPTAFEDPPAWAKEVVWYQIFVERFRNGDPDNDPTPEDIKGAYPGFVPEGWKITPGLEGCAGKATAVRICRMKQQCIRIDLPDNFPVFPPAGSLPRRTECSSKSLRNYLDSLGVTAIYFNPLNDAPSLHKYDARHWRHIDRNFGPDPEKDRKTMASETPDDPFGEVWWEQWPETMIDPEPFLRGDIFDSNMNYRWYRAARHFFNEAPDELPVSAFVDSLEFFRANLREESNYALMNLTASHDVPRTLTSLFNKTRNKYQAKPEENPDYKIHKPDEETYQTLRLLLAHQFTYIGAPHIWAGDEMGMWGPDDPGNRKPLIWKDYDFEPETHHPLGHDRPKDEVKFNEELFNYYRKLIALRKGYPVLVHGDIDFILKDNNKNLLAYSRNDDASEAIAVFNAGKETVKIELPVLRETDYQDVLGEVEIQRSGNSLSLELPGRSAAVLVSQ